MNIGACPWFCKSGIHLDLGTENYEPEIADAVFAVSEAENAF